MHGYGGAQIYRSGCSSVTGCVRTQAIRPELQNLARVFLRKISNDGGNRTGVAGLTLSIARTTRPPVQLPPIP